MIQIFLSVLPWLVLTFIVLGFSLADDLPAPAVERAFWSTAVFLLLATAAIAWISSDAEASEHLLVAAGPTGFLVSQRVLRAVFRRWKGDEPVVVGTGSPGSSRFFFEPDQHREEGWMDYAYTFALGFCMLLAAAPAIARFVN